MPDKDYSNINFVLISLLSHRYFISILSWVVAAASVNNRQHNF